MTCSFMVESMAIANAVLRQKAQEENGVKYTQPYQPFANLAKDWA